jgi:Gp37 protein
MTIEQSVQSILDRLSPLHRAGVAILGYPKKGGEFQKPKREIEVVVRWVRDSPIAFGDGGKRSQNITRNFTCIVRLRGVLNEIDGLTTIEAIRGLLLGFSPASCQQIELGDAIAPTEPPSAEEDWVYELRFSAPTMIIAPSTEEIEVLLKRLEFVESVNDVPLPLLESLAIGEV